MARRLCRCGHRFYKHQHYPIDTPHCKALPWQWFGIDDDPIVPGCKCSNYVPMTNLEYLESLVDNN